MCTCGGKSHITVLHSSILHEHNPTGFAFFLTFLILLLYPSLTLRFFRYSSVSRCAVHEVDKECRTYSGGPFSLSRGMPGSVRSDLSALTYRNYITVSPGTTTRHERKPYKGTASGVTQNPCLSVTALLIPQ